MKKIYLVCCFAMLSACAPAAGGNRSGGGGTPDAGAAAPECTRTRDCAENERCVDQQCVEVETGCNEDTDCAAGQRCDDAGQCVEATGCTVDTDCLVQGQVCENSMCKSAAYGQCASNDDCAEGTQCLLEDQQGQKYCGTLCTDHPVCSGYEQCQNTVCAPNVCENAGQVCDAHATADGLCLAVSTQASLCIAGAANGAGCEPFADASTCADSESCQPVSAALGDTYCGAAGSLPVGSPCENGLLAGGGFGTDECVQGAFCLATGQGTVCLGYCRLGQNDDCPEMDGAATVCQPMSALHASLANSPWGVCTPPQQ